MSFKNYLIIFYQIIKNMGCCKGSTLKEKEYSGFSELERRDKSKDSPGTVMVSTKTAKIKFGFQDDEEIEYSYRYEEDEGDYKL